MLGGLGLAADAALTTVPVSRQDDLDLIQQERLPCDRDDRFAPSRILTVIGGRALFGRHAEEPYNCRSASSTLCDSSWRQISRSGM